MNPLLYPSKRGPGCLSSGSPSGVIGGGCGLPSIASLPPTLQRLSHRAGRYPMASMVRGAQKDHPLPTTPTPSANEEEEEEEREEDGAMLDHTGDPHPFQTPPPHYSSTEKRASTKEVSEVQHHHRGVHQRGARKHSSSSCSPRSPLTRPTTATVPPYNPSSEPFKGRVEDPEGLLPLPSISCFCGVVEEMGANLNHDDHKMGEEDATAAVDPDEKEEKETKAGSDGHRSSTESGENGNIVQVTGHLEKGMASATSLPNIPLLPSFVVAEGPGEGSTTPETSPAFPPSSSILSCASPVSPDHPSRVCAGESASLLSPFPAPDTFSMEEERDWNRCGTTPNGKESPRRSDPHMPPRPSSMCNSETSKTVQAIRNDSHSSSHLGYGNGPPRNQAMSPGHRYFSTSHSTYEEEGEDIDSMEREEENTEPREIDLTGDTMGTYSGDASDSSSPDKGSLFTRDPASSGTATVAEKIFPEEEKDGTTRKSTSRCVETEEETKWVEKKGEEPISSFQDVYVMNVQFPLDEAKRAKVVEQFEHSREGKQWISSDDRRKWL